MNEQHKDPLAWEEISTEHIVKDEWVDFKKSAFRFPDGSVFEPYYSYSRKNYVVIIASDPDGNVLCVRQYRQGVAKVTTEFPAGAIEWDELRTAGPDAADATGGDGAGRTENGVNARVLPTLEEALPAAKRELREETGYESDEWKPLQMIASNATMADNYAYVYVAANCCKVAAQDLDETEFLHVSLHTPEELEQMIRSGTFEQAVHIAAWYLSRK